MFCCCEELDKRVKKLSFADIKLMQLAALCLGIIIAKLFPLFFAEIRIRWILLLMVLLMIKPFYASWIKK